MFDTRTMTAFLTLPADMARAAMEGWQRGWRPRAALPVEGSGFAAMDRTADSLTPPLSY